MTPVSDICGWGALAPDLAQRAAWRGSQRADFVVIGGGFTGLAAARQLAMERPDARVVLVEGKQIAGGASARNSGFAVANESPGRALLHTAQGLADYMVMNRIDHAGVAELRQLVDECQINCQWEDTGSIHAAHNPANFGKLQGHVTKFHDLGVDARLIEGAALAKRLGTSFYGMGVESRGGALLQPAMLAVGLAANLPDGVECYEDSPVQKITRDGDGWRLDMPGGSLRTAKVILAVNAFFARLGLKRLQIFPLALTGSLTRPLTAAEEAEIGHARTWGILSPQRLGATLRLTQDRRILMRNTVEYRPGGISAAMLAERQRAHVEGLQKRFPFLGLDAIEFTWSGTVGTSRNAKPVFEETHPGLYLCGGYNGSGIARGTIMGRLIADLAMGEASDLLSDALSLIKPALIPPRPFFDIGAVVRMRAEKRAAKGEG